MRQTATASWVAPLWEPATVLPSQVGDNHGRAHRPELYLVSAIFEDALHSVFHNVRARRGRKRREFLDACDWFWSEAHEWPFAFVNVCDLLGIEGRTVRDTIRAYIVAQHDAAAGGHPARHWGRRMLRKRSSDGQLSPCERLKITGWDEV
ncbi:MAG TPA: hypothetical protein VMW56_10295 [Candidatus Margulisiibacteriota bacterium]|nr:hypothetical protein [Candidatus Margulisiibacteriota bacterium]